MAVEHPTLLLVLVDILIYAFVAHSRLTLEHEATTDLFGTPLLAQEHFDLLPGLGLNARCHSLLLSCAGQLMSLFGTLAALPPIAADLTRDRAFVDTDLSGDLGSVKASFHEGVNLVSLLLGEMRIVH